MNHSLSGGHRAGVGECKNRFQLATFCFVSIATVTVAGDDDDVGVSGWTIFSFMCFFLFFFVRSVELIHVTKETETD